MLNNPTRVLLLLLFLALLNAFATAQDARFVIDSFETATLSSAADAGVALNDPVYAVHMRSTGTYTVFGVDMVSYYAQSDIVVTSTHLGDDWATVPFSGSTDPNDVALSAALRSYRSSQGPSDLTVQLTGLVPGERYTVHWFQAAAGNGARSDRLYLGPTWVGTLTTPTNGQTRNSFEFVASAASHTLVAEGDDPSGGTLANPMVNALAVTRAAGLVPGSFAGPASVTGAAGVASLFDERVVHAVSMHPSATFSVLGVDVLPVSSVADVSVDATEPPLVDWAVISGFGTSADDTNLAAALRSVYFSRAAPLTIELGGLEPGKRYTLSVFQVASTAPGRGCPVFLNGAAGEAGQVGASSVGTGDQTVWTLSFVAATASHKVVKQNAGGDGNNEAHNPLVAAIVLQEAPVAAWTGTFAASAVTGPADVVDSFDSRVLYAVHPDLVGVHTLFGATVVPQKDEPRFSVDSVTDAQPNWSNPVFGSSADDDSLEDIIDSIQVAIDTPLPMTLGGLTPGELYRVTILQGALSNSKREDGVFLNSLREGPQVGTLNTPLQSYTSSRFEFVAGGTEHAVILEGGSPLEANDPLANPLYAAVIVQALAACDTTGPPASPTLVNSSVSGADLVLEFESDPALTGLAWNFVGGTGCDNDGTDATGGWVHDTSGCLPAHTLTKPVTALLATCGFSAEAVDGGDVWYYEAVVEATAVNDTSAVFGDDQTRTEVTSFRLRVEFPKNVSVSASSVVFGPLISQARVTTQAADTSAAPAAFEWTLATSVQHPYELVAPATTDAAPAGFDAALAVAGTETCTGTDECTQRFTVSGTASAATCSLAGSAALTFTVKCRDGYTGSCDLPSPATVAASFSFETDDFCPRVVEVASITPALTTYSDSDRTSVSTNYILETTMYARVTADVEAGLRAQRTTLTGLDIVSSCTGCTPLVQPFTDGLSDALADYGFQYAVGGTDNSVTGEVETDFSFTLNTNSLSFDNDASTGEAQITLTAYVTVEYDTPSAQGLKRSYRVQAVSGPGSIGSSASANFGVSSAPAGTAGGSSSTAGSTVLGVSTGTAALAAVGLAAVAAIAFGAALAARRRRRTQLKHTSSSLELNDTAAVQA